MPRERVKITISKESVKFRRRMPPPPRVDVPKTIYKRGNWKRERESKDLL